MKECYTKISSVLFILCTLDISLLKKTNFKVGKLFLLLATFLFTFANTFAQTPGMVVVPATGIGPSILDPNGDGYVSVNNSGFVADDQLESELPFAAFIFPGNEPTSDLNNGPDCNFTDFVDDAELNRSPAQKYLDANGNWLFRFRMGGIAPNSKSYSILIDTDGLFGNSGAFPDPDYTLQNPGFEIEIVLATGFGVFVYDVQNLNCSPVISYPGTTNYQKAIAFSTNCGNPDYFLDFFVVFQDLANYFGITPSTPMRFAILDNTAANKSSICNPNSVSDVAGVGNCPNLAACFEEIINYQGLCAPEDASCLVRSVCPIINQPINSAATLVSGTSVESNGTIIRVFKNGALIGTTTVSAGIWSLTGINPALAGNDVITATAEAPGEFESIDYCSSAIVGATCTDPPVSSQISELNANKGIRITFATAPPAGTLIYMYNPDGTLVSTAILVAGSQNPISTIAGTTVYNFECQTGNCFPGGTYYFAYQQPGQCQSTYLPYCFNTTGNTEIPVVTTTPITSQTTSISGNIPSPDNVANVAVTVYVNGFLEVFTTTNGTGQWTANGLNLQPCDIITVRAARPTECISAFSNGISINGGVTSTPILFDQFCSSGNITSVSGISGEANGTQIQILVNGSPIGSPASVTNGQWTVGGLNIVAGASITATALAPCKTISSQSDPITVTLQSSNSGLTITTNPIVENSTSIQGTGNVGDIITLYIDGWPLYQDAEGTTLATATVGGGGTWTVSTIHGGSVYAGGVITASVTAGGGCASAQTGNTTVICVQPINTLSISPEQVQVCDTPTSVTITIENSQPGVIYQLFNNSLVANTGSSVLGNGNSINISSAVLSQSATISVLALKFPFGLCTEILTETLSYQITQSPSITTAIGSNPTSCGANGSINLTFTNVADGTYTVNYDGGSFTNVTVTSGSASIDAPAGTYNDLSITVSGCTSTDDIDVTLTAPSTPSISLGTVTNPSTCGGTGSIVLNFTNVSDGTYTIDYSSGSFTGVVVSGGTATIVTTAGAYNNVSITVSGCTSISLINANLIDPICVITAEDDNFISFDGLTGATNILNVLDNDELNEFPVNLSNVSLTLIQGDSELFLNPDGSIDLVAGTIPGIYTIEYQICETLNLTNCSSAIVTITVIDCDENNPLSDCDGDGVTNGQEITDGTDPNNPCSYTASSVSLTQSGAWLAADCDGDGVTNGQEITDGTDPNNPCSYTASSVSLTQSGAWLAADCDGDGVTNGQEITDGTDPNNPCSYTVSSVSLTQSGAWLAADCDGDGVTNGQEITDGTDSNNPCSYTASSVSLTQSGAWLSADCDGDGVTNGQEITDGTDPNNPCSYTASSVSLTQSGAWLAADCDGDGVTNGQEVIDGTNPNNPCESIEENVSVDQSQEFLNGDCDGDGLANGDEIGSNPNNPNDTNGNGIPDYLEFNTKDIEVFNLVTPNGDGDNDVFIIKNIEFYPNNTVQIYNRWGVVVYETRGYGQNDNYFRGISEGRVTINKNSELPVGTYFYVIIYKDDSGKGREKSGYLYINR
jgi:gliding motility-associated-like protein